MWRGGERVDKRGSGVGGETKGRKRRDWGQCDNGKEKVCGYLFIGTEIIKTL